MKQSEYETIIKFQAHTGSPVTNQQLFLLLDPGQPIPSLFI